MVRLYSAIIVVRDPFSESPEVGPGSKGKQMWSKPYAGNPTCYLGNSGIPVLPSEPTLREVVGGIGCCYLTRSRNPIGIIPNEALEKISSDALGNWDKPVS